MKFLSTWFNFFLPPVRDDFISGSQLSTILVQERERILTAMLRVMVMLGLIAFSVALPFFIQIADWFSILIYTVILIVLGIAGALRRLDYRVRVASILVSLYGIGLLDLIIYGLGEDGRIFLFAFCVTAVMLLGARVGIGALALSTLTIGLIGWLIISHQIVIADYALPLNLEFDAVISFCVDFLASVGLLMAALYTLLRSFDLAWQKERQATHRLQQERDLLEQRVSERTVDLSDANKQLQSEIAERKQAEESLKQARDQALAANHLKTELLAKVSHELRTPLGAILGFTEMLEGGLYGSISPQQQEATTEIVDSCRYLEDLVDELLDQAQLEAGRLKLNLSEFNVSHLMHDTISKMNVLAQAKGLTISSRIDPGLPTTLSGDSTRLQQILVNLVSNAIKFTSQGTIAINFLYPDPHHWAMQVSDTGPGISAEAQIYIFEPFRQVDGSLTRTHTGTGLGLSIVKQLTTLMGGEVSLKSEVGRGSTFTVVLPLKPILIETI